jgi:hypothetical protein
LSSGLREDADQHAELAAKTSSARGEELAGAAEGRIRRQASSRVPDMVAPVRFAAARIETLAYHSDRSLRMHTSDSGRCPSRWVKWDCFVSVDDAR